MVFQVIKKASIFGIVSALVVAGSAHAQLLAPTAKPKKDHETGALLQSPPTIQFDEMLFDFGVIPDEGKAVHKFYFKNTGGGTLVIKNIRSSCGCTVPALKKREFAPGEGADIEVTFSPYNKRGLKVQPIHITTNDPDNPVVKIEIKALVEPRIWVEPAFLQLGQVGKSVPVTKTIKIYGRDPDFKASLVTVTNPEAITTKILGNGTEEIDGKTVYFTEITVTVDAKNKVGRINESITIRTNDQKKPRMNMSVIADVTGDLAIRPSRLWVGVLQVGQDFEKSFVVMSRSGTPFKIVNVTQRNASETEIEFDIQELDSNYVPGQKKYEKQDEKQGGETKPRVPSFGYTITLKGTAPAKLLPFRGQVMVQTDNKDQPSLSIPFNGTIRPKKN